MAFEVRIAGCWHSTDDLTGEELEAIEAATSTPWSILNPLREFKAFVAIAGAFFAREGKSDEQIKAVFAGMTAKTLRQCVRYVEDGEDLPDEYRDGIPFEVVALSTPSSSPVLAASDGHLT